jgi:hypothetical protein
VNELEDSPTLVYDHAEIYRDGSAPETTGDALIFPRFGDIHKVALYYTAAYEEPKVSTVYFNYIVNNSVQARSTQGFTTEHGGSIVIDCPEEYAGYPLSGVYEHDDNTRKYYKIEEGTLDYKTNKSAQLINLVYGGGINSALTVVCVDENGDYLLRPQQMHLALGSETILEPFAIDFYTPYSCHVDGEYISDGMCGIIPKKTKHQVVFTYKKQKIR